MLQTPPNMLADEFAGQASCLFCSSQAVQDSAVAPLFENAQCTLAAQLPFPAQDMIRLRGTRTAILGDPRCCEATLDLAAR